MSSHYTRRRFVRHTAILSIQFVLLVICHLASYWLRLDMTAAAFSQAGLWPNLVYSVGIQLICLEAFGLSSRRWRYFGLHDVAVLLTAITVGTTIIFILRNVWSDFNMPRGVILIDYVLSMTALGVPRVLSRVYFSRLTSKKRSGEATRALIIGAGDTGAGIVQRILSRPDTNLIPVAILDDDPHLHGLRIHSIPVVGAIEDLKEVAEQTEAKEVLICMPGASGPAIRRAVEECVKSGLHARILPGITQVFDDKLNLANLREVEVTDLLGREPVRIDQDAVSSLISGRSVLVTGAGGSIGAELCRQVLAQRPSKLILVDQAEPLLFMIEQELLRIKAQGEVLKDTEVKACVGSVCDENRLNQIFQRYKPEIVCHAAAHKHVPMMEANPTEAIKNNVFGTIALANTAVRNSVRMMVMISTDKAINPTSVMGATKRIAELYVQGLARRCATTFVTVRFGNVLGSSGSVIPIFKEQIRNGGPITVTHPDMTRYFMLIPEAVQLVLQAATFGKGAQIFLLDMGDPIKIVDMARELIRLCGLRPDEDIKVKFTGLRPGEKLFEELRLDDESIDRTPHERIRVVKAVDTDWDALQAKLKSLQETIATDSPPTIREAIKKIVPEYTPSLPG